MRIRAIKPDFFTDEKLSEIPSLARIFFIGLWCVADKEGRLEDKPKKLKVQVLPYDDCNVNEFLDILHDIKCIARYTSDNGEKYIQINKFCEHQRPHHTERQSIIPPCKNGELTVNKPLYNRKKKEGKGLRVKGLGLRVKGIEKRVGARNNSHQLTDDEFFESLKLNPAYKGIDVEAELLKMDIWLSARPARRKTRRFVVGWLGRVEKDFPSRSSLPFPGAQRYIDAMLPVEDKDEKN